MSGGRRRAWVRRGLGLLVLAAFATGVGILAWRQVGYWLVVSDPLTSARAIVVPQGDFPFRAMEAAAIYRAGWAPEVWLLRAGQPDREAALSRLGWHLRGEEESNRALIRQLGVPNPAIRVLEGRARNTREEITLIERELARVGGEAVVIVTSKPHSRRVRSTWLAVAGTSSRAIVRFSPEDPFDAGAWWRNSRDALAVSREVLGLLNVWAGFPVHPDEAS